MLSSNAVATSSTVMSLHSLEEEIEDVKKSGSLIRLEAPLLQHWPWDNGIPLEHGSMRPHLEKALEGREDQGDMVELVLVSLLVCKLLYHSLTLYLVSGPLQGTACTIPFPRAFTILVVVVSYNQHRKCYNALRLNEYHPDVLQSGEMKCTRRGRIIMNIGSTWVDPCMTRWD